MSFEDNPADDRYELDQCIEEINRLKSENATLQKQVDGYRAAVKPIRDKFHEFQNGIYRGEWNQYLFNAGAIRDILAAMPGGRYDDELTKTIVGG